MIAGPQSARPARQPLSRWTSLAPCARPARLASLARLARTLAPLVALAALLPLAAAHAGEPEAMALLERMRSAATAGNYQGTMVFSANGAISSSRVWHYCVGDQTYERLEAQDGRQQTVLRHNDELRTVWPQLHLVVIEQREPLAGWTTKAQAIEERALLSYELRVEGQARVAGRDASVLLLEPRDTLRYAQRLWVDRGSGLMLRADILGPGNAVLETAAFSEVEVGVKPDPQSVLRAMRSVDARSDKVVPARAASAAQNGAGAARWRALRPTQRRTQLESEGWSLQTMVPGFRLASCSVRGLDSDGHEMSVLQAVFSDGLTHVSLFVEPYRPGLHRGAVQARLGATGTVTRRVGEHWITVVGDAPEPTLRQFAQSLEPRR